MSSRQDRFNKISKNFPIITKTSIKYCECLWEDMPTQGIRPSNILNSNLLTIKIASTEYCLT